MKNPFLMSLAFCRIVWRLTHHKFGKTHYKQPSDIIGHKTCRRCEEVREVKRRKRKVKHDG